MGILLIGGHYANERVPPISEKVVSVGNAVTDGAAILRGQDVYQRYGLMDHGSVWGHGSLRGMDFSAYTLHCMGVLVKQHHVTQGQPPADAFKELPPKPRRDLDELDNKIIHEIRANRYDEKTKTLELTPAQTFAVGQMRKFWEREFSEGDEHYGFLKGTIPTAEERRDLADFFFWTAWAAGTDRPGLNYSYTNNWPSDPTVGNKASAEALVSSLASIIALFLVMLGLVSAKSALRVAYLTAILVFISGIPGTAHHYFWYGGPSFWLAIGGVFSSLEPIPMIQFLGFWRVVPDTIIIVLSAFPLLFFLLTTYLRLRKIGEKNPVVGQQE